jgi:hypothetical protein
MAIDLTNPEGEYGGSAKAVAQILQLWGLIERDKQERQTTETILQGVASGRDLPSILRDVASQQTQYGSGVGGAMRRFSSNFMPPSQTQQTLTEMGLGMASPQAQANLEGTQARTALAKEQTTTEQQSRPLEIQGAQARVDAIRQQAESERALLPVQMEREQAATEGQRLHNQATAETIRQSQAEQPGQQQKQALDIERAQMELREARMRLDQAERADDPALKRYQHHARMAELSLGQLRHGQFLPGEPEYQDATEDFEQARQDMERSWMEYEGRGSTPMAPPTQVQPQQQPPQVQPVQEPPAAQPVTKPATKSFEQQLDEELQAKRDRRTQAANVAPVPGLLDVWPKLSEEDRQKTAAYQKQIVASGDVEALIEFHRKVRELFK